MKIRSISSWVAASFFIVVLGFVHAALDSQDFIAGIELYSTQKSSQILVRLNSKVEPLVEIDQIDSSIRVSFIGAIAGEEILNKPFSDDFIRLGYLFNYKGNSNIAGLKIFPRKGELKSLKKVDDGILISISENSLPPSVTGKSSVSLLNPLEEKFSPVVLNFSETPSLPVILTLADKADIDLKFSGFTPEKFSMNLETSNAKEALKAVAKECGGKLVQDGKGWAMVGVPK